MEETGGSDDSTVQSEGGRESGKEKREKICDLH